MVNPVPISICRRLGAEKVIAVDLNFPNRDEHIKSYKEHEGVYYLCFGNLAAMPIHRIDKDADGVTRQSWAFGKWEDAETIFYIPINQTREIDAKDWEAV